MNNADQYYTPPLHTPEKGTSGYRVNKTTIHRRLVQLVAIVLSILIVAVLARIFSWALDNEPMYNSDTTVISSYTPASEWVEEPVRQYKQVYVVNASVVPTPAPVVESIEINQSNLMKLAKTIYGEARGESYYGKLAVGTVIMNRMIHPNQNAYGGPTLEGVIYMKHQYQGVGSDEWNNFVPDEDSIKAARKVLGGYRSFGPDVLFHFNEVTSTDRDFVNSVKVVATIGRHSFGTIKGGK